MSRSLPRVAYLGPKGSFSSIAARRIFPESVRFLPRRTIRLIFSALDEGKADFVVAPIESSQGGTVQETVVYLCRGDLREGGRQVLLELDLRIRLSLVGNCPFADVRTIYSHPQAIHRADEWLRKHAPNARIVGTTSTAEAARIARRTAGSAALASEDTAALFNVRVLRRNIGRPAPTTFLVIGGQPLNARRTNSPDHRTSAIFTLRDRPGSLARALHVLSLKRINLTRILSIPIAESPGEYMFLVEWSGGVDDRRVREALDVLRRNVRTLKLLGSYSLVRL